MDWRVPIVDLRADWAEIGPAVEEAALRVLRSGRYVLGAETQAFEAELAERVGTRFAVGVASGTDALALALRALGVGPGDEVVVPGFTYFATVEAVALAGARPVFADVEAGGSGLDAASLEAALGPRTRAVVPVHLFGRCVDVEGIGAVARRHGVPIVEDAAQALGAARAGRRAGAWGSAGCFSFYPSKTLGAAGDGGCVTTDDPHVAERVRLLRSHGEAKGGHVLMGTTARLDALQAAVLRAKLPALEGWIEGRARNARVYAEALAGCPDLEVPVAAPDEVPSWQVFTLRCWRPEAVRAALEAAGIEWRHYYETPAYAEPALADARLPRGALPNTERACAESLSIPVRGSLAPEVIREIAAVIRRGLEGGAR